MSSESFNTGAKRGSQVGKGRPDLISPWANQALAAVLEAGAAEYGDRNWERGIPIMRHMASCKRHIDQFIMRLTEETKDGKVVPVNHLWNAYANLMMAIHTMEMIQGGALPDELDDRPDYKPATVGSDTQEPDYKMDADGYEYFLVSGCPHGGFSMDIRRFDGTKWEYWWQNPPVGWLEEDASTRMFGSFSNKPSESFVERNPGVYLNPITHKEWLKYADLD